MSRTRFALITTLAIAACAPPPPPAPDVAAITKAIEAQNATFVTALEKGDTVAMADHYQDDAMLMVPNAPAATGRAAIMSIGAGFVSAGSISAFTLKTHDVIVAGDYAVETGAYEWTFTPKQGKPAPDKGKYVTLWHKQADGSWKLVRDINNTDLPAGK